MLNGPDCPGWSLYHFYDLMTAHCIQKRQDRREELKHVQLGEIENPFVIPLASAEIPQLKQ